MILLGAIGGNLGVPQMKLWKSESLRIRASMVFLNPFERDDFPLLNDFPASWGLTKRLLDAFHGMRVGGQWRSFSRVMRPSFVMR